MYSHIIIEKGASIQHLHNVNSTYLVFVCEECCIDLMARMSGFVIILTTVVLEI